MLQLRTWKVAVLASLFSLTSPAGASAGLLGVAGNYGEFILGNSTRTNTDSRGPIAVGGNAVLTNFGIAHANLSPQGATAANLVVGGTLNYTNGEMKYGSGYVGGAATTSGVGLPGGGTISQNVSSLPINFAAEANYLQAVSAAQYDSSQAFTSPVWGGLTFNATNASGANFFNVQASDLSSANSFTINASANASVIVNVVGTSASFQNAGVTLTGGIASAHVIWNFVNATSLTIQGIGVNGTILAPKAAVNFSNGQINGSLIAASLTGSGGGETHIDQGGNNGPDTRFSGVGRAAGAVPEPSSVVMLGVAAAAGLGFAARRRARVA